MLRRAGFAALIALAVLASLAPSAPAAKQKGSKNDLITTAPDFASFGVKSIALLPVATFDGNAKAQRVVADIWSANFRESGYRWVSSTVSHDLLLRGIGDSALKAVTAEIVKQARVDSLSAPLLCSTLHTSAVLSVRVDQWESSQLNWAQTGKPSTSVQIKAALVDATGRLLWSASGRETAEGREENALERGELDVLRTQYKGRMEAATPSSGQSVPTFEDVLRRLFARWLAQFPQPAAAGEPAK
jgi:hypothetical protein